MISTSIPPLKENSMLEGFVRPDGSLLKTATINTAALVGFGLAFIPVICGAIAYDTGRNIIQPALNKAINL